MESTIICDSEGPVLCSPSVCVACHATAETCLEYVQPRDDTPQCITERLHKNSVFTLCACGGSRSPLATRVLVPETKPFSPAPLFICTSSARPFTAGGNDGALPDIGAGGSTESVRKAYTIVSEPRREPVDFSSARGKLVDFNILTYKPNTSTASEPTTILKSYTAYMQRNQPRICYLSCRDHTGVIVSDLTFGCTR